MIACPSAPQGTPDPHSRKPWECVGVGILHARHLSSHATTKSRVLPPPLDSTLSFLGGGQYTSPPSSPPHSQSSSPTRDRSHQPA